ncbi:extracellular matrix FRAS1 [Chlorella sorokiniana]|uniref:Extracellular matrix FRAS1 n=1 Tax=Chlorella sorokiniana TaxID=3076 RepID=A0A2P6TKP4_CHLSO|nr:extracellular matrix FRAS1 [Chlorella sorokiniana]|eukprot:PRW44860.1 extracellular matrix FRAS1 [Chlorella sorokiniana]
MAWNTPVGCQALSKNAQCGACTSDGACTLCANANHILVPLNAIYINAAGQGSQCMAPADVQKEGLAITGKAVSIPTGCKEVDTEFKCIRCANTQSLTNGKCVALASGSKCKTTLPFYQYCAQCDATGKKCLTCNGSRSPPTGVTDGRCALPCKQLFGIGCSKCNQAKCATTDAKYAQGRKRMM